ncbi:Hypothetical predicted protein [Octopus vulgaris]|uniref:Uncharacterized protein n=2 Tax=Octopus TaxID=6643 RepID=A0AA36ARF2_OCTVU|nr:uncharacterized protein LOC118763108 [Octopus sinensis]CAI9720903.1 Hypothetical predicted protein [Octopus vulgaris]
MADNLKGKGLLLSATASIDIDAAATADANDEGRKNRTTEAARKNESEPVIAADLTRYATPLALLNGYGKEMSRQKEALTKKPNSDGVIIAADLTKYNNPLDNEKMEEMTPLK